jgi:hypothetical protein
MSYRVFSSIIQIFLRFYNTEEASEVMAEDSSALLKEPPTYLYNLHTRRPSEEEENMIPFYSQAHRPHFS